MARSRLLQALTPEIAEKIAPSLDEVSLPRGAAITAVGEEMQYVFFPTSCLISVVVELESGGSVEATTVGNDGFVNISALLGLTHSDTIAMVQVAGDALRMDIEAFRVHLREPDFRRVLGAYASRAFATVAQSAACMAFHPIQERLARWLLMVSDGIEADEFALTQDFIAIMLGSHRPTVTVAVSILEKAGLLSHRRGVVKIEKRDALIEAACECYRVTRRR